MYNFLTTMLTTTTHLIFPTQTIDILYNTQVFKFDCILTASTILQKWVTLYLYHVSCKLTCSHCQHKHKRDSNYNCSYRFIAFIEEFLEFASNTLPEHQNSIYIGDFNLHVSKEDTNPAIFNDSIEAMGLYQHVGFHTHQGGNILDLIISDICQQTTIVSTAPGPFLSDHLVVIGTLNVKKMKPSYAKIKVRQIHEITDSQWINELNTNNLELTNKLDTLNKSLSTELTRVLNTLAPEKECKINLRTKRPWYDADLKEHKRQVRRLEKKWLKYKNEGCHIAFKKCRNSYYGKLNAKKKSVLQSKFQDCGKDSRKIHALMTNLTTKHCE